MICPQCGVPAPGSADFCIFCGKRFTRAGRRARRYDASKTVSRPFAVRAERFSFIAAVLIAFAAVCGALVSHGGFYPPSSVFASVSPGTAAVSPFVSTPPAETPSPASDGAFSGRSGSYSVFFSVSEVNSSDPETRPAGEAIRNERFRGAVTLAVDASGEGTLRIEQAFFSPQDIRVSAFANGADGVSANTLYGFSQGSGYALSVVCVCSEEGVSGFVWLDSDETHIEFLYFG